MSDADKLTPSQCIAVVVHDLDALKREALGYPCSNHDEWIENLEASVRRLRESLERRKEISQWPLA